MSQVFDPHIDWRASERWQHMLVARAPWLHEEVARRMGERLACIRMPMQVWTDWSGMKGGGAPESLKQARLSSKRLEAAGAKKGAKTRSIALLIERVITNGVSRMRGILGRLGVIKPRVPTVFVPPVAASQDMIWSNMQLHMTAASQPMMTAWFEALKTDGFVMFSCLGPDTLKELRAAYARRAWPAPLHDLTDMHDWGDRLVALGFSQPVMDMERVVLAFATPERALQELRELGRNLHPERLRATCGRAWYAQLLAALEECRNAQGLIELTFELIYGHAIKPQPRVPVAANSVVSLARMREMLAQ